MKLSTIKSVKLRGEDTTVDVPFTYGGGAYFKASVNEDGTIEAYTTVDEVPPAEEQIPGDVYIPVTESNAFEVAFMTGVYEEVTQKHTFTFPDGTTFEEDLIGITYNPHSFKVVDGAIVATREQQPAPTRVEFFAMIDAMIESESQEGGSAEYAQTLTALKASLEAIPEDWNFDMYKFPAKA